MKSILIAITAGLVVLGSALLRLAIAGVFVIVGAVIPWLLWLLWNHALAPLFHGPHLRFFQVVGILWLLGFVLSILNRLCGKSPE